MERVEACVLSELDVDFTVFGKTDNLFLNGARTKCDHDPAAAPHLPHRAQTDSNLLFDFRVLQSAEDFLTHFI